MPKRKNFMEGLRPKSQLPPEEPKIDNSEIDGEHLTEGASLEDYEKAEVNETKMEFSADNATEEMSKMILTLRSENEILRDESAKLKIEISNLKSTIEELSKRPERISEDSEAILMKLKEAETKNEEMTMLKSKMEMEIRRLTEIGIAKQSEIDSLNRIYTRDTYDPSITVRGGGFRSNINGYQDWN